MFRRRIVDHPSRQVRSVSADHIWPLWSIDGSIIAVHSLCLLLNSLKWNVRIKKSLYLYSSLLVGQWRDILYWDYLPVSSVVPLCLQGIVWGLNHQVLHSLCGGGVCLPAFQGYHLQRLETRKSYLGPQGLCKTGKNLICNQHLSY